ncbi:MAG: hypothetical protein WBM40_03375 [Thiohalocapsa sp.]
MQTVTSREYKLMLRAAPFAGDEAALNQAAASFWRELAGIVLPSAVTVSGTDDITRKRRKVRFFDTADHWLRRNDYVVRERVDLEKDERQLTLKFRHADRFISQDRDMQPADGFAEDMKFEEDIKPRFQSLYSFSSSIVLDKDDAAETIEYVCKRFPGLAAANDAIPKDEALIAVGDFTGYERVIKGTTFQIRKDPQVFAECSLTLWYADEQGEAPILAEFSFKYEDAKEDYTATMARRAHDAFIAMQEELGDWLDAESMTKTAYVYALGAD